MTKMWSGRFREPLDADFERKVKVLAMNRHDVAIVHGLEITAPNACAISEEEAYETIPMDNIVTHGDRYGPS